MRNGDLTYDDFLQRLNIQDILIDAGYHLNKRDGLRYPSYVRMDSEGRRIRGDKFIVMPNGKCCFKAQEQKVYNIISFIKEYPQFFAEYRAGVSPDRLVNLVCNRLLNHPIEERSTRIIQPKRDVKPFDITDYEIHRFNPQDRDTQKKFYPSSNTVESTSTRSMPSTVISTWRQKSVKTGPDTRTLPFRCLCPKTRGRLSALRNEAARVRTAAAVTRARLRAAIQARVCG